MAKRKYPEQRSATAQPRPGQMPAKPTGNEIFNPSAASQGAQASAYTIERLPAAGASTRTERAPVPGPRESRGFAEWIRSNWVLALAGGIAVGVLVGTLRS